MTRSLRPRNSKTNYAALVSGLDLDGENNDSPIAGPSTQSVTFDEVDSGSDFSLEKEIEVQQGNLDDNSNEVLADENEGPDFEDETRSSVRKVSSATKPKTKTVSKTSKPSVPRAVRRQMYVLPTPSVHHRHRAVPLYTRTGRVERLESPPQLFKPPRTTMTNNFTQNSKVTDRVNKAWGYNVGWGPLWEMVEDRAWYKEAIEGVPEMDSDTFRRPRVYSNIYVKSGWQILNRSDATPYLPTDAVTTEEGDLKPPPPVSCLLGPFNKQTKVKMEIFETYNIADFIPENTAHIFNAGAPVWGIDWCPIHPNDRLAHLYKQYLAVAPFPTREHSPEIGVKVTRPFYACIQIWSLGPTRPVVPSDLEVDKGEMKCEMVLCLDAGPAHELKWCPLPAHDDSSNIVRPRKLGLLGGSFEDGSWALYAVPDPRDVTPPGHDPSQPVYIKIPEPLLRMELEETNCWAFDWANSELVAIGTTNGIIAIYDIGPCLKAINNSTSAVITNLLPTHYITVHQSAIRALAWIRAPSCYPSGLSRTDSDPTVIASGGYDGVECITDIREGHGSVMNRTRDVINALTFSYFGGGPITIDHENTVKSYSVSPSMLGRGHTLLEPQGPVWSLNASDLHPQLAVGSADGSCTTTNSLRSTRRGGSVPFFIHKVYQLDYSRNADLYRMLECFLPQETQDRPLAKGKDKDAKDRNKTNPISTGAWAREVGVHRVTWNSCNGLTSAGLLASGTASGLCRVDELWGRWIKGKVPYAGIEHIRMELDDDVMDVDADSDDSAAST